MSLWKKDNICHYNKAIFPDLFDFKSMFFLQAHFLQLFNISLNSD